ncbi:MAG: 3-deoxy-manno-octulosonate cytidylyltransferase [Blastocatellia bacterium]|nr:3-deoxy-manno-octulosonate cytidylyltransferase [Blastocatellia bacterium]
MKGKKPKTVAIIPARYASTRLPGKPLLDLAGKPIIQHVYEQTSKATLVNSIVVATDDQRILTKVEEFGGKAVMTSSAHETGTDRLAEVARSLDAEIVVNVQGDEPFISPETIDSAILPLIEDKNLQMSTTCEPLARIEDLFNPNVVKVVLDQNQDALYFSRAPIPFPRSAYLASNKTSNEDLAVKLLEENPSILSIFRKHTGLYVYRRTFLLDFTAWPRSPLEQIESLEQLRALERGYKIRVIEVTHSSLGIDTAEDLARARHVLNL